MTPALLGLPILENPKANIRGSGRSWEDLEKAGLITLRDKCVELPFIFVQIYAQHLRTQGVTLTGLIDILNELRGGSSWRQNEKCDLAVVILQILHWYYNHPNRNSFRLEEVFWGVKGTAASAELDIPKAIKFTDILDTWPICLESMFNPEEHLREGAYLGCGQDMFADSWIVFNRARDDGKVVLAVESKQRTKPEPLTAKYFNDHKKKVTNRLQRTPCVFIMVADMLGDNIEAAEDEIIITEGNMDELYGRWLGQRRRLSLLRK
ncbi:hypothetical protein V8E54_006463 [Elaphomyces granulatus]